MTILSDVVRLDLPVDLQLSFSDWNVVVMAIGFIVLLLALRTDERES